MDDSTAREGTTLLALLGAVAVLVIALLVGGVWAINAALSGPRQSAPASPAVPTSADQPASTTQQTPTETFTVPTPTYVTPSLTVSLGPAELPTETAPPAAAPPAPAQPAAATPGPAPGPTPVDKVNLACVAKGGKVTATLTFETSGPATGTLSAGDRTQPFVATPPQGTVSVTGRGDRGQATCSAVINGRSVGPVPAS